MTKPTPNSKFKKKKPVTEKANITSPGISTGPAWVGMLAAATGIVLYLNTLGHQYCLDDYSVVKENWIVKGGFENLGLMFSTEYRAGYWSATGTLYRPLALVIFSIQWALSPDNPLIGHLMNILMYGLLGWCLWMAWRRILVKYHPLIPALGILFFMAHPVHTEVVANIKSSDEILALLFCTLSLYALWKYFESPGVKWLWIAPMFFAFALFTKENAITYLAIFPLVIWFFTNTSLKENMRVSALFLLPAALFLVVRYFVLSSQSHVEPILAIDNFIAGAGNLHERFASACMMWFRYVQTLFIPYPLVSDLGYPQYSPVTFADWRALSGAALFGAVLVWVVLAAKRRHFPAFAILLFLICFSISGNLFFLIGTSYAERLLFSPSLGFTFAVAWGIHWIFKFFAEGHRTASQQILNPNGKGRLVWAAAGVILVGYSVLTIIRNRDWYDSFTLYTADIKHAPNSAKLNYLLGLETVKKTINEATGEVEDPVLLREAIGYYGKSIELFPENPDAYGSRGLAYASLRMYNNTYADYQAALRLRPDHERVLSNLGFIYFMRNQLDSAEYVFQKAVELHPGFVEAWRNLGAVKANQKEFTKAIEFWKKGLEYDPGNALLMDYIGNAYREIGQVTESKVWLARAEAAK